ncbi:unnamed protein product, partial [Soboliphyme baturini]|uniref:Ell-associated factor Eaf n=1 Tax=Soboliphyme baturini TaxID=241478 RepID=A0A183IJX1_9BILA
LTPFFCSVDDFKPASVEECKETYVEFAENNEVAVTIPKFDDATIYRGNRRTYQKECLLIYNHETNEWTLQQLTYNVHQTSSGILVIDLKIFLLPFYSLRTEGNASMAQPWSVLLATCLAHCYFNFFTQAVTRQTVAYVIIHSFLVPSLLVISYTHPSVVDVQFLNNFQA